MNYVEKSFYSSLRVLAYFLGALTLFYLGKYGVKSTPVYGGFGAFLITVWGKYTLKKAGNLKKVARVMISAFVVVVLARLMESGPSVSPLKAWFILIAIGSTLFVDRKFAVAMFGLLFVVYGAELYLEVNGHLDSISRTMSPLAGFFIFMASYAVTLFFVMTFDQKRETYEKKIVQNITELKTRNKILEISTTSLSLSEMLAKVLDVILLLKWERSEQVGALLFLKEDEKFNLASQKTFSMDEMTFGTFIVEIMDKDLLGDKDESKSLATDKDFTYHTTPIHFGDKTLGVLVIIHNKEFDQTKRLDSILKNVSQSIGYLINSAVVNTQLEEQKRVSFHQSKLASLGQLAGGVGHEINNPLTVISGHLTMAKKRLGKEELDKEKILDSLAKVELASTRISNIVKGLRNFSRLDNQDFEIFCVASLLRETVDMYENIYKKQGIDLLFDSDLELFTYGNRGRVQQVFVNLISNAKDAMTDSEDKQIAITIDQEDNLLLVRIKDTGSGIPEPIQDKIFDPFFTSKGVNEGTGIGLSLSYQIIKEHGGKLKLATTSELGTTFEVELVNTDVVRYTYKKTISTDGMGIRPEDKRILLVDDEEEILAILEMILTEIGFRVEKASNGVEALNKLKTDHFDAVMSDIKMPDMNGIELVHNIQTLADINPKVVLMTGGVEADSSQEVLNKSLKLDGFLEKPFTEDSVKTVVLGLFETKKSEVA